MTPKIIALMIFAIAYLLFMIQHEKRTLVAVIAVLLLLISGALSPHDAFFAVNWNIIGIFVGMLIVSSIFSDSKAPEYISEIMVRRVKTASLAMLLICGITGFISAFVDNVSTVLIVAPFAISMAKSLKINPTNLMIGIAISSNLQGTATLIGDPPSMLLAAFAKMNFWDFFFYHGRPGIFFAVQAGAVAAFAVLYYIFRKETKKIHLEVLCNVSSWWPSIFLVMLIFSLAGASFIKGHYPYISGSLCMAFAFVSLVFRKLFDKDSIRHKLKSLDWDTSIFLASVFIIVGSMSVTGWVGQFAYFLSEHIGKNIFLGYTIIVFFSVFVSAFIDNIPFLAAMLPVAITISNHLGIQPPLLLFGLLIGSCLGGNITPIGASANIAACGILKKEGYPVKFGDFVKIGLPFTMAAVMAGYLFIWFVWR